MNIKRVEIVNYTYHYKWQTSSGDTFGVFESITGALHFLHQHMTRNSTYRSSIPHQLHSESEFDFNYIITAKGARRTVPIALGASIDVSEDVISNEALFGDPTMWEAKQGNDIYDEEVLFWSPVLKTGLVRFETNRNIVKAMVV